MTQKIKTASLLALVSLSVALACNAADAPAGKAKSDGVIITPLDGKLRVEVGGELFTEYYFKDVPRPYFYPIIGPGGAPMTRNWPMKNVENEDHDHPHHRSLWYAHGDINGHDFWAEGPKSGKTVHEKFIEVKSGAQVGVIKSQNKLVAIDGTVVGTDERTATIHAKERIIDFDITVHASQGVLTFGDTKEGTMAMRLAETMRFKGKVGKGHIINSEGVVDDKTWGQRAAWVDYHGPVNDKQVGVAMFDHPQNPRHPTWWHVRDYGLFAANPFGLHDFEKSPDKTKGNLVVPAGQSVTFRYRIYIHAGDEKEGRVAEHFKEYVQSVKGDNKSK
jgi:hypothetical protein